MPFSIRHLKIRDQVFLASLPPLFVLLCAMALFFYAYWVEVTTNRSSQRVQDSIVRTESLLRHLTEMHMGVLGYLFTHQSYLLRPYQTSASGVGADLSALEELEADEPDHAPQVASVRAEVARWTDEWASPTVQKVRLGEALDLAQALADGQGRLDMLRAELFRLLQERREKDLTKRLRAEQLMRRVLFLELGITSLLGAALIFLTWSVTRILAEPVLQLIEASERVSRGDFGPSLPPPSKNEFGVLSQSFSRMMGALRDDREEMAALSRFSDGVTQCTSEGEIYDLLLHSLRDGFHPRQVIIFKLDRTANVLEAVATLVPLPQKVAASPVIEDPGNCKAVRMKRPFLVSDVTLDPVCPAKFAAPSEGSYYCRPLIAGGNIIGAVRLEGPEDSWTAELEALLESYMSTAAASISNLRALEAMKQLAIVDTLTGLHNRRFLKDYALKQIAMARRRERRLGFITMDIDHFKSFNDKYGHEAGDRILRQFAQTVTRVVRDANLATRLGGEEFLVLLPETDANGCMAAAERIRRAVTRMTVSAGDKTISQITVSLGIAVFPDHGSSVEEVLQASDKALYESKRNGRNRATLFVEQAERTR